MKQTENGKQIRLGMLLSYLNLALGNFIPFFYTPIMLQLLGQSEYGLYKIAGSTTSYLSLMTLGVGSAVSHFLLRAITQEGVEAEKRMFGLFQRIFRGIALCALLVGGIVVWKLDVLYGAAMSAEELLRLRILLGIMAVNTALGFSATAYTAVTSAHERFVFIHGLNIVLTVGMPLLNLVALYGGFASVGMAVVSLLCGVVARIVYFVYVRRKLHIRPSYERVSGDLIREILKYAFWAFVASLVSQIYSATDTVIIGATPGLATTGAAVYGIGATFISIMFGLSQITPTLFTPRISKMVFSGADNRELTDVTIRLGRLQGMLVLLICSGFVAFGKPFIACYAGEAYADAYWVAVVVMIPNCIPLVQSAAHSILHAKNMHRFRAITYLVIAIVNVIFTVLLVKRFGVIGAAVPTGVAYIIGHGLIMNWYYGKKVGLDIVRFWKSLLPIFAISMGLSLATIAISRVVNFYDVKTLTIGIICYTLLYGVLLWMLVLNREERHVLLHMKGEKNE